MAFITAVTLNASQQMVNPIQENNRVASVAQTALKSVPLLPAVYTGLSQVEQLEQSFLESKETHFYNTAYILIGLAIFTFPLGFINPIFFAISVACILTAAYCGFEGYMEQQVAQQILAEIHEDAVQKELEAQKQAATKQEAIEFYANTNPIAFTDERLCQNNHVEQGMFTRQQIINFAGRATGDQLLGYFISYTSRVEYPYSIDGKTSPEEIFKFYVRQVLCLEKETDELEALQRFFTGAGMNFDLGKRVLQMSALLKLVGDGNQPFNNDFAADFTFSNRSVALEPFPIKNGTVHVNFPKGNIGQSPVGYRVEGEVVGLYPQEEMLKLQHERIPIAHYQTSRTVEIAPPDAEGNVNYTITRHFKRIV